MHRLKKFMDGCIVRAGAKPIDRKKPTKSQKLSVWISTVPEGLRRDKTTLNRQYATGSRD
jgi:hypothetical protein